jgi:drug/metabolite transporter (DMT)-like permease
MASDARLVPRMVLMAAFGFVGFNTLFYIAATETTAVNLGIIQGSMPILVLIGSVIAFGSKVRLLQVVGILATLLGVTLIAAQGSLDVLLSLAVNPGDGVMLIACVLYSGYTLALRNRPQVSGLVFFAVLSAISVVASLPGLAYEMATGHGSLARHERLADRALYSARPFLPQPDLFHARR